MEDRQKTVNVINIIVWIQIVVLAGLLGVVGYRRFIASPKTPPAAPASARNTSAPPASESPKSQAAARRSAGEKTMITKPRPRDSGYDSFPLPPLRQPSILIEKSRLRLTILDGGQPVKRYRAAIGANKGDKVREGDQKTPEGEFYVCVKNHNSKYVLSLGLSYPNIADARRGLRDGLISRGDYNRIVSAIRNRRQPPWNTKLGGEIMIHGKRLGGRDTLGCIALEDEDIRELFPRITLGTKVTIAP
jgi:lipoprotein-anchoring transpeptidase ErfK/SrfK